MAGINKWIGIGRLGKDPETRYTQGGDPICSFSVAVDESYKNKSGEKVSKTEWVNITAFGKLAEICQQYLTKGKLVYIEGKLQTDSWEKEGQKHYATKIIAGSMQMLDSKKADNGDSTGAPGPDVDVPF